MAGLFLRGNEMSGQFQHSRESEARIAGNGSVHADFVLVAEVIEAVGRFGGKTDRP